MLRVATLLASLGVAAPVVADPAASSAIAAPAFDPSAAPSVIADRRAELDHLESQIRLSDDAVARLQEDIGHIDGDAQTLREDLLDSGRRVHDTEAKVLAAESRLSGLAGEEQRLDASLARRRGLLIEVVAALQRMGHRPPPALLVRPEDALGAIRTAMLLGTLLPQMRQSLQVLASDLQHLASVRQDTVAERDGLKQSLVSLAEDHARIDLLAAERQRALDQDHEALAAERQKSALLAHNATSLRDLIGRLEAPAPGVRTASLGESAAAPSRLTPSRPFESLRGSLGLPVTGAVLRAYGQDDGLGSALKGVTVSARSHATVTAPCDGSVVYAGPFRSYGQLLIINAGGGYHVVLAGMERVSVDPGQVILAGEPVATMGAAAGAVGGPAAVGTAQAATGSGPEAGGPLLYVEFRKDGTSIDPGPWWAPHGDTQGEKARG